MPTVESVRERMREALRGSGLTQQQVGERMGIAESAARQAVSRIVRDNPERTPSLATLIAFANALDVPPATFFRD